MTLPIRRCCITSARVRILEDNLTERSLALRAVANSKDPFENMFVDLGGHSADKALLALTGAMHAEHA